MGLNLNIFKTNQKVSKIEFDICKDTMSKDINDLKSRIMLLETETKTDLKLIKADIQEIKILLLKGK